MSPIFISICLFWIIFTVLPYLLFRIQSPVIIKVKTWFLSLLESSGVFNQTAWTVSPFYIYFETTSLNDKLYSFAGLFGIGHSENSIEVGSSPESVPLKVVKSASRRRSSTSDNTPYHSYRRFSRTWFDMGVYCTLLLSVTTVLLLVYAFFTTIMNGLSIMLRRDNSVSNNMQLDTFNNIQLDSQPGFSDNQILQPLIPGVNLPWSDVFPVGFAIFISVVLHELGHAFAAFDAGIKLDQVGFSVFPPFITSAFVEFPTKALDKLTVWSRLRIWCAGIWHNVIVCSIAILLLSYVFSSLGHFLLLPFFTPHPVIITDITATSPFYNANSCADSTSAICLGSTILSVNNRNISDEKIWFRTLHDIETNRFSSHSENMKSSKKVLPVGLGFCVSNDWLSQYDSSIECCVSNNASYREKSSYQCFQDDTKKQFCAPAGLLGRLGLPMCNSVSDCGIEAGNNCIIPSLLPNGQSIIRIKIRKPPRNKIEMNKAHLRSSIRNSLKDETSRDRYIVYLGNPREIQQTIYVNDFIPRQWVVYCFSVPNRLLTAIHNFVSTDTNQTYMTHDASSKYINNEWFSYTISTLKLWNLIIRTSQRTIQFLFSISAAVGLINSAPVYSFDGEHILENVSLLSKFRCLYNRPQLYTLILNVCTGLLVFNIIVALGSLVL